MGTKNGRVREYTTLSLPTHFIIKLTDTTTIEMVNSTRLQEVFSRSKKPIRFRHPFRTLHQKVKSNVYSVYLCKNRYLSNDYLLKGPNSYGGGAEIVYRGYLSTIPPKFKNNKFLIFMRDRFSDTWIFIVKECAVDPTVERDILDFHFLI